MRKLSLYGCHDTDGGGGGKWLIICIIGPGLFTKLAPHPPYLWSRLPHQNLLWTHVDFVIDLAADCTLYNEKGNQWKHKFFPQHNEDALDLKVHSMLIFPHSANGVLKTSSTWIVLKIDADLHYRLHYSNLKQFCPVWTWPKGTIIRIVGNFQAGIPEISASPHFPQYIKHLCRQ